MRSVEPGELLEAVIALLQTQVLPAIEKQSARSTLLLIIGLLDNLASRIEERRDIVERSTRVARNLLDTMPPSLKEVVESHSGPGSSAASDAEIPDAEYGELSTALSSVLRHLAARDDLLADHEVSVWLDLLRRELRDKNVDEIALMRPTRYMRSQSE